MKAIKKLIIMALVCICTVMSAVACYTPDDKGGEKGLLYKKINGVYTIYKYVDEGEGVTSLNIEEYLEDGVDNVRIKQGAFNGNDTLEEIIVPSTVTLIDEGAFQNMKSLQHLHVPFVGLTSYADTFVGETLDDPDAEDDKVKAIDSERTIAHFFGTGSYDDGVPVTINYGLLSGQSKTVYVPLSLRKITVGINPLQPGENKPYYDYKIPACAFNGFYKDADITLCTNITEIGEYAFANANQLTEIQIPTTVTKIGKGAFSGASKLATVNFADLVGLTEIAESAFANTGFTTIVIPNNVVTIGDKAFMGASKLTTVTMATCVKSIGDFAFYQCEKLTKVYTDGVTGLSIGNYAFGDCNKLVHFGASTLATNQIVTDGFTVALTAFNK